MKRRAAPVADHRDTERCARRPTTAPSDRTARRERAILGDDLNSSSTNLGARPGARTRTPPIKNRIPCRSGAARMVETAGIEPATLPPEGSALPLTPRLCGCGGRTCTAAGTAYEAAALLLGDTASIGGPLENRTLRSLIASEARRPWNMAARVWWERTESNRLLLGFNETLEPFQLHSRGGVGASRTRSSPSRLIDVADRRLTVRPPLLECDLAAVRLAQETRRCPDRWSA